MNTPLQAMVFDAYGTLFDPYSVRMSCEALFPEFGTALSLMWRTKQLEYTWLRSLMNRYEDFWSVTEAALRFSCRSLDLRCGSNEIGQLMDAYLRLSIYPDVREALDALEGIPLLILSNGSPGMLQKLVEHAGLTELFSDVLSVDQVKIYKPAPPAYQLAVEATGLKKNVIGFVSSNCWDVAGATSFGFETFWINRGGAVGEELGVAWTATLQNLTELAPLTRS